MSEQTEMPWKYSIPIDGEESRPNLPTQEGRAAGMTLALIAERDMARMKERFPDALPMCDDCALRQGTDPNGCLATLGDVIKCIMENQPFFCHKGVSGNDEPKRLCAGYAACSMRGSLMRRLNWGAANMNRRCDNAIRTAVASVKVDMRGAPTVRWLSIRIRRQRSARR